MLERERAALEILEAAEADADEDARAVALLFRQVEVGLLERHLRRGHREGDEARDLLDLLFLHERGRVEVLHLGRDARRVDSLVASNSVIGPDAALALDERAQARVGPDAVRRDETEASDYDALHEILGMRSARTVRGDSRAKRARAQPERCFSM